MRHAPTPTASAVTALPRQQPVGAAQPRPGHPRPAAHRDRRARPGRRDPRSPTRPRRRPAWSRATGSTSAELRDQARTSRRDGRIREAELELPHGELPAGPGPYGARIVPVGGGDVARRRRRPHRGAAGRGGPPRLRRQRRPRAQDAGRRASRCWPRPSPMPPTTPSGAPLRRPDAARGAPADPAGAGAASTCPGCRAPSRCPTSAPVLDALVVDEAVDRARLAAQSKGIGLVCDDDRRRMVLRRRAAAGHRGGQPARQRGRLQPGEHPGRGRRIRAARRRRRGRGHRPGHRHRRGRAASGSSSGSTGSTRRGRARPAAPASGLAIVKHIVDQPRRQVSVWSRRAPAPPSPCGCRPHGPDRVAASR